MMLVRLFGRNFRSLKDAFELSMVAADSKQQEDRDRGVVSVPIAGMTKPLRLLRAVAIYGANASGKSSLLDAGHALNWIVAESSARSKPENKIPSYEPFLLDDASRVAPVELGCDVTYEDSLLRYEIAFLEKTFVRETLTILNGNGETRLIDRQPSGDVGGDLVLRSDVNKLYVKEMQPNVAVLSKLSQHGPHKGPDSVQPYYKAIQDATRHQDYSDASMVHINVGGLKDERFADDLQYREWIMRHLMTTADIGICDVEIRRESSEVPDFIRELFAKSGALGPLPDKGVIVSFVHEGVSRHPIDLSHESSGTRKLFNLAGDWWTLANEPVTFFADELSAGLHPRLLDSLIRAVNDVRQKDNNSQLIFATHDTGLLEGHDGLPPALRRDQVYFTKKDSQGASEVYSLTEFKDGARNVHNIRKRYLSGLYGAIPSAEKVSL